MRDMVLSGLHALLPVDARESLRRAGAASSEDEGFAQAGIG